MKKLIEDVAEKLWQLKHPNKGRYKMLDEMNKDYYRTKAREIIALFQPTFDEVEELANKIVDSGLDMPFDDQAKEVEWATQILNALPTTPTPEPDGNAAIEHHPATIALWHVACALSAGRNLGFKEKEKIDGTDVVAIFTFNMAESLDGFVEGWEKKDPPLSTTPHPEPDSKRERVERILQRERVGQFVPASNEVFLHLLLNSIMEIFDKERGNND